MDRITIKASSLHHFLIDFLQSETSLSKTINNCVKSLREEYGKGITVLSSLELLTTSLIELENLEDKQDTIYETVIETFDIIYISRDTYSYDKWLRLLKSHFENTFHILLEMFENDNDDSYPLLLHNLSQDNIVDVVEGNLNIMETDCTLNITEIKL